MLDYSVYKCITYCSYHHSKIEFFETLHVVQVGILYSAMLLIKIRILLLNSI